MNLVQRIQQEDPCYDPLGAAIAQLRTDDVPGFRAARAEKVLNPAGSRPLSLRSYAEAAWSRVSNDGYHGPLRDDDWAEQDGRRPYSVSESLDVLAVVADRIEGYSEETYYDPETGESQYEETVSARDVQRALFTDLVRIYGCLPW